MKNIVFITPRDARYGFSISGAIQYAVEPDEAAATLGRVMADPDSGVVVIDERLMGEIGDERFREMERRWHGVLIVLPAPETVVEAEDYALRLIRRAIGYHVRLQL